MSQVKATPPRRATVSGWLYRGVMHSELDCLESIVRGQSFIYRERHFPLTHVSDLDHACLRAACVVKWREMSGVSDALSSVICDSDTVLSADPALGLPGDESLLLLARSRRRVAALASKVGIQLPAEPIVDHSAVFAGQVRTLASPSWVDAHPDQRSLTAALWRDLVSEGAPGAVSAFDAAVASPDLVSVVARFHSSWAANPDRQPRCVVEPSPDSTDAVPQVNLMGALVASGVNPLHPSALVAPSSWSAVNALQASGALARSGVLSVALTT